MKITHILTSLGLSKNEALVYMTLLTDGMLTISGISRASGLHRPAIYATLPELTDNHLITERQVGKLIYYAAEPPERLRRLLDEMHHELDSVIPELTKLRKGAAPLVRRLEGRAGIHAVYEDIVHTLKKSDVYYRYSSEGKQEILTVGEPPRYVEGRDKKQLERFVITNPEYVKSREPRLDEALKVVPKEFLPFDYGVSQVIYGNKIAFIDYRQELATIIEHDTLAKFQCDIFRMLFKRL